MKKYGKYEKRPEGVPVKQPKVKSALLQTYLTSLLCMVLCVTMFFGTSFAWFTSEVKNEGNEIYIGTLDVALSSKNGDVWEDLSEDDKNLFDDSIRWEPGYTALETIKISNKGDLAFRYALTFTDGKLNGAEDMANLKRVAENFLVYVHEGAYGAGEEAPDSYADIKAEAEKEGGKWSLVRIGSDPATLADILERGLPVLSGTMSKEDVRQDASDANAKLPGPNDSKTNEKTYIIALHMKEEATSLVMGNKISLSVKLVAHQLASEEDAFDDQYDTGATAGMPELGMSALEIRVRNDNDAQIGSVVVPAGAIADWNEPIVVTYAPSDYKGNFTVADGMETHVVDITVTNLAANNSEPVKANIRIAAGLAPDTVKLYHNNQELHAVYDPHTGYVTFETTSFSPFTVVYDAESKYNPTNPGENDLPKADVVRTAEHENVDLPWGSYGAWSPTEGLDSRLEAAYTFTCKDDPKQAEESPYANWYCDFYVKLDKDLGANQIFLGGNYGSFGWVGFHNGDLTLEANTEIPLLGSVTTNPWTYAQVAASVGEFICGVGDVDNALTGATFTVMLRLTNPENEAEYHNVATITYTFA